MRRVDPAARRARRDRILGWALLVAAIAAAVVTVVAEAWMPGPPLMVVCLLAAGALLFDVGAEPPPATIVDFPDRRPHEWDVLVPLVGGAACYTVRSTRRDVAARVATRLAEDEGFTPEGPAEVVGPAQYLAP